MYINDIDPLKIHYFYYNLRSLVVFLKKIQHKDNIDIWTNMDIHTDIHTTYVY